MNTRAKFVISIGLLGLLCLLLPGSVRADTTYMYTGNAYTLCDGSYTSSGGLSSCIQPYALTLTFDTTLSGSELEGFEGDITADLTSFSITDGGDLSINQTDPYSISSFVIGTSADGAILVWNIDIATGAEYPLINGFTRTYEDATADDGIFIPNLGPKIIAGGEILNDAGQWVGGPVITPEPPAWLLLGTGLLVLIAVGLREKILEVRRREGT